MDTIYTTASFLSPEATQLLLALSLAMAVLGFLLAEQRSLYRILSSLHLWSRKEAEPA